MIHLQLHWPEFSSLHLWPLAIEYATWIYNRLPKILSGLSPLEIWTGVRASHDKLRRAHVFGFPVYVLDPKLQDGKQILKWNSKACQGMFVGFSKDHSSLVPLVLNLKSGKILPQFHVIFDDKFQTVPSMCRSMEAIDDGFEQLFCSSIESFLESEYDDSGCQLVPCPELDDDWLDTDELKHRRRRQSAQLLPYLFPPVHLDAVSEGVGRAPEGVNGVLE
ncbi:hypothetical protein ACHAXS_000267 [Conticribra weissflogii]